MQEAGTGCTVILCKEGAVAGVDVRGWRPCDKRNRSASSYQYGSKIHAVMLSGGSAYGLEQPAVLCSISRSTMQALICR